MAEIKNRHAAKLNEIRGKLKKKVLRITLRCTAFFLLTTGSLLWMYFTGLFNILSWVVIGIAPIFVLSDTVSDIFDFFFYEANPDIDNGIGCFIVSVILTILLYAIEMCFCWVAFLYLIGKCVVCRKRLKHVEVLLGTKKQDQLLFVFAGVIFLVGIMSFGAYYYYPFYQLRNNIATRADTGIVKVVASRQNWVFTKTRTWGIGVVVACDKNAALILTNRYIDYVIEKNEELQKGDRVTVKLCNGTEYTAHVAALPRKKHIDMALLYVDTEDNNPEQNNSKDISGNRKLELSLNVLSAISKSDKLKQDDYVMSLGYGEKNTNWESDEIRKITNQGKIINQAYHNRLDNRILFDNKGNIIGINSPSAGTICDAVKEASPFRKWLLSSEEGGEEKYREHAAWTADCIMKDSEWDYYIDIKNLLSKVEIK